VVIGWRSEVQMVTETGLSVRRTRLIGWTAFRWIETTTVREARVRAADESEVEREPGMAS
jgi:hypothetical protein